MSSPALPRSPGNPMRQQLDELDDLLQRMLSLPVNQLDDAVEVVLPEPSSLPAEPPKSRPVAPPIERINPPELPALGPTGNASAARVESQPPPAIRAEPAAKLRGPIVVFQPISSPSLLTVAAAASVEDISPSERPEQDVAPTVSAGVRPPPVPSKTKDWGPVVTPPAIVPETSPVENFPELPDARWPLLERHKERLRKRREATPSHRPFGWFNHVFDRFAVAIGGPALWFIQPQGRAIVGWMGIGLLLVALTILLGDWYGWSWPS